MRTLYRIAIVLVSFLFIYLFPISKNTFAAPSIISINQSSSNVSLYDKFEVTFNISGTVATNLQWPYDPDDISGLTTKIGITVDGQDFIIWLTHYGQSISGTNNGDYDGNEKVEIGDYTVWVTNY